MTIQKLEYYIKDKDSGEIKEIFLCSDLYKIKSNKIIYCDGKNPSKLDMTPRLNFINTAYKELTGLDKCANLAIIQIYMKKKSLTIKRW